MLLTLMQNWPGVYMCHKNGWSERYILQHSCVGFCMAVQEMSSYSLQSHRATVQMVSLVHCSVCVCIHLKFYLCTLCVLYTFQFIPLPIDTYRVRLFNDVKNAQLLWTRERIWETVSQPDGTWGGGEREQCRCGASSQWETEHLRPRLSAP